MYNFLMVLIVFGFAKDVGINSDEIKHEPNIVKLLKEATMTPHMENGKVVGYKVQKVKKGSAWEKMGLKVGDIVKNVDGKSVANPKSPQEAMEVYQKLKRMDQGK